MKNINEIFDTDLDIEIRSIKVDSQKCQPGDLFVCTKGMVVDRHDFIDDAIRHGASCIITSHDINQDIPYIKVDNPNAIMLDLLQRFYDNPQKKLKIIGITGTDGKTTTTTIIQKLLGDDKCGYIGTNGHNCKGYKGKTDNTTPGIEDLYEIFYNFVENGCKYASIEASSEGFFYHRLDSIDFEIGGITNITSEHLNTHKTLENYIACKCNLFKQSKLSILNKDDKHFNECTSSCSKYLTYGFEDGNDLQVVSYDLYDDHTDIVYKYKNELVNICSPLLGKFNVENISLAILTCLNLGLTFDDIRNNLPNLKVSGRMEEIKCGQNFRVIVDYAHTPNGITRLFEYVKNQKKNRIITVIGQAGGRDPYKRKDVGKIVSDNSDLAIFTYEDPRNEDIDSIIDMIVENIEKNNYLRINDRKEAITYAINNAEKDDIVLILGKGSEDYQIVKGQHLHFCDIEEAELALKNLLNK